MTFLPLFSCCRSYTCEYLWSSDQLDLFVPHIITSLAQSRSSASIGPSLWNRVPSAVRSTIISHSLSSSFSHLKSCLFSRVKHTGSASERLMLREEFY